MYNLLENRSSYSYTTGIYEFILKIKQLILTLILVILMILNLSSITLKIGNSEAGGVNKIFRNATISVSLMYLSKFLRSLEMPLLKCN